MHLKFISILSFTGTFFLWDTMFYSYKSVTAFLEGVDQFGELREEFCRLR